MHQRQTAFVTQVDAQAFFAHVLLQKVATYTVDEGGRGAAGVALGGPLNLDDIRTQGSQAARHMRARQEVAVVNHADTLEREGLLFFCHKFILKFNRLLFAF